MSDDGKHDGANEEYGFLTPEVIRDYRTELLRDNGYPVEFNARERMRLYLHLNDAITFPEEESGNYSPSELAALEAKRDAWQAYLMQTAGLKTADPQSEGVSEQARGDARDVIIMLRAQRLAYGEEEPDAADGVGRLWECAERYASPEAKAVTAYLLSVAQRRWRKEARETSGNGTDTKESPTPQALLTQAADAHIAQASYDLGEMYEQGEGVTQDYDAAHRCYRRAAEDGHAPAWLAIARDYHEGHGVEEDHDEEIRALLEGEKEGDYACMMEAGDIYSHGHPGSNLAAVPRMEDAKRHYQLAAEVERQRLDGDDVPRDYRWPALDNVRFTEIAADWGE